MHIGKTYKLVEFIDWTRRDVYLLAILGIVPVLAYQAGGQKWLAIPWTVVALLGTATAFLVGFKNLQTYNRAWEARQVWGDILSASRAWGISSRDFVDDPGQARELVYRHLAWLTALRYRMREARPWESTGKRTTGSTGSSIPFPRTRPRWNGSWPGTCPRRKCSPSWLPATRPRRSWPGKARR